ncbi:tyrosine-type recombinase/integrase [Kordia sp. TARA_039_SRF]|nr:tyrosine-type recombinase/integrase [Kordia sp. TARA_039_SRF]
MQLHFQQQNVALNVAKKMSKTLHKKIVLNNHQRNDGTYAIYLQLRLGKRKLLNTGLYVKREEFDAVKQRVNKKCAFYKDYNLILEDLLSKVTNIQVAYRLSNHIFTLEELVEDLENPMARTNFVAFYKNELENQKQLLKHSTYKQQKATLSKLEKYMPVVFFHEIDENWLKKFVGYLKSKLKNKENTINGTLKNIKKYVHIANSRGIQTPISYDKIKVPSFKSKPIFLHKKSIDKLKKYLDSEFVNETHRNVLRRFLFSCYTGLRISDNKRMTRENILENYLIFTAEKTNKLQRILLNETAKSMINKKGPLFDDNYTPEYINRALKEIAKICGIKERLTFHVSRHTFATQYILAGGNVTKLQKLLAHSNIRETMIYVHIVDDLLEDDILNMD